MQLIQQNGYKFAFNPESCKHCKGKCCIGESGYIWISQNEISNFAKHLNMQEEQFKIEYLRKVGYRYSIKEVQFEDGFACIFFDTKQRCCKMYDLRPIQCKTYPFWEHFKINQNEVEKECIGIVRL